LIHGVGKNVNVKDFGSYLAYSLRNEDMDLVRITCGIISDLAGAFEDDISVYLNDFVPPLIDVL